MEAQAPGSKLLTEPGSLSHSLRAQPCINNPNNVAISVGVKEEGVTHI